MSSTIVPWTSAGGVPCCCETACAFPTSPPMPNKTVYDIDATLYAAMYAGGVVDIVASGSGSTTSTQRSPGTGTCSVSTSPSADLERTLQQNRCESAVASTTGTSDFGTVAYTHYLDHAIGSPDYKVFFSLELAKQVGQSCGGGGYEASLVMRHSTFILGDQGTTQTYNCGFASTCLSVVTPSTLTVNLNGGDVAYIFAVPSYDTQFNSGFPILMDYTAISGSISGTFTYSPSAP
jgi:hypothetical protein